LVKKFNGKDGKGIVCIRDLGAVKFVENFSSIILGILEIIFSSATFQHRKLLFREAEARARRLGSSKYQSTSVLRSRQSEKSTVTVRGQAGNL